MIWVIPGTFVKVIYMCIDLLKKIITDYKTSRDNIRKSESKLSSEQKSFDKVNKELELELSKVCPPYGRLLDIINKRDYNMSYSPYGNNDNCTFHDFKRVIKNDLKEWLVKKYEKEGE